MSVILNMYLRMYYIHIATSNHGSNRGKTLPTTFNQEEFLVYTEHHSALLEGSTSAGK